MLLFNPITNQLKSFVTRRMPTVIIPDWAYTNTHLGRKGKTTTHVEWETVLSMCPIFKSMDGNIVCAWIKATWHGHEKQPSLPSGCFLFKMTLKHKYINTNYYKRNKTLHFTFQDSKLKFNHITVPLHSLNSLVTTF